MACVEAFDDAGLTLQDNDKERAFCPEILYYIYIIFTLYTLQ